MLQEIVENRRQHIERNKELYPVKLLEKSIYFESEVISLADYIQRPDKSGIIAEFKRRSPSKGMINQYASVQDVTIGYMQSGASALSVLTEPDYFSGTNKDLKTARDSNYCPILRKDFIVDEYQIIETKSIGADAVLLIAACLTKDEAKRLYQQARAIGLEVLFEIHSKGELEKLPGDELIIGVNNRDLKTMKVNIQTSLDLAAQLSEQYVLISESGISSAEQIQQLKEVGYGGFLMGEAFMKTPQPAHTLSQLVNELQTNA